MTMALLVYYAVGQQFTNAGVPLNGGKLYTYLPGTTTLTTTYTDITGDTENSNPITLDANGRITTSIWIPAGTGLKVVMKDRHGNTLQTTDNIPAVAYSGATPIGGNGDFLNVLDYGATGDGITDDTAAIQAAINAAEADSRQLYFPAGTYACTALEYSSVFKWFGDSNFTSIVLYTGVGGRLFQAASDCAVLIGSSITDMWIKGPGNNTGTGETGFRSRLNGSNRNYTFNRVRCSGFNAYGFEITDSFAINFTDCYIITNGTAAGGGGVYFRRENYTDVSSTGNRFINCYMASANFCVGTPNNVADQMLGSAFYGCFFESSKYGVFSPRTRELSMVGCYFEDISIAGASVSSLTDIECYYNTLLSTNVPICTGSRKKLGLSDTDFSYNGTSIFTINHNDVTDYINQATFKSGAIKLTTFGDSRIYRISGSSPEGVQTAGVGSICIWADSGSGATMLYVKATGSGNTGWVALGTSTTYYFGNGNTAGRPGSPVAGQVYSDTTVGNTLVWDGARWRNSATGVPTVASFTNGGSTTLADQVIYTYSTNTSNIGSHTITMPANPVSGDRVVVSFAADVTTLTVSANAGQSIRNAPTTITAGNSFEYIYNTSTTTWYRIR